MKRQLLLFTCLFVKFLNATSFSQVFSETEIAKINLIDNQPSTGTYESLSQQEKNDVDSALVWLEPMFKDPRFENYQKWLYYNRGRIRYFKKQLVGAQTDLETAVNLDTLYYDALERLCVLSYWHLKGYTKRKYFIKRGIIGYESKLKADSTNDEDWYYYAKFLDLQAEFSGAENVGKRQNAYKKCIQIDSTKHYYYYELSMLYYEQPEFRIQCLQKALQLGESGLYRTHIIAILMQNVKNNQRSLDYITCCINLYEKSYPEHRFYLYRFYTDRADVYKLMNKPAERAADLKKAKFYQ